MANGNTSLTDLFTNICNAIRAKEGSSNTIPATEIASRITALKDRSPNGTKWTQSNCTTGNFNDSLYYANGIWITGCAYSEQKGVYYSTDGKTWTRSNITTTNFS